MSVGYKRGLSIVLALFIILTFQNCEGLQPTGPAGADSASANGDGYSGLTVEYPETVESGSQFAIRVNSFTVQGLQFQLLEGLAEIIPIEGTRRAIINVSENYIGSLIVQVTTVSGSTALVEVQVVAPTDITAGTHNQTFGKHMILAGKRIVAAIPKANDKETGAINQGRVQIFNHNPLTDEIKFHQSLHNPEVDPNNEVRFGQSLDGFRNFDLIVGAPLVNKVYHYHSVDVDDRERTRYELVDTFANTSGKGFGASVIANEFIMIISEKGENSQGGTGKIYIHRRASADSVNYEYTSEILAPNDISHFGRSMAKYDNLLIVSAVKQATIDQPRHGVILIYDLRSEELVQTIDKTDVSFDFGRSLLVKNDFLFLGASYKNEQDTDREFIDIYSFDSMTGTFLMNQRISNPLGPQAQSLFSESLAFVGDRLFVSAPLADSPQQKKSGVIYIYRLNNDSRQFSRVGMITPSFEKFDYVLNLGRALACDDEHLFISVRGVLKNSEDIKFSGDVYAVPLTQ